MKILKVKVWVDTLPSQRLPFVLCRVSSRGFSGHSQLSAPSYNLNFATGLTLPT